MYSLQKTRRLKDLRAVHASYECESEVTNCDVDNEITLFYHCLPQDIHFAFAFA